MGNLCPCFRKKKANDYDDINTSLMASVDGKQPEDMDEWEIKDLRNKNTTQIQIVDEGTEAGPPRKINVEDFQFLKLLGKGAFGKVLLVEKKSTKQLFAMKILRKDAIARRNQKIHTKAERSILENMTCPFIVQLHYAFQSADKLYLVMDFMSGGELFFHLRREKKFTEPRARFYIAEIILALEYLHNKGIIYRDLKPENILMDGEGHLRIADFGLSKQGVQGGIKTYTLCGTPEYLAPEILQGQGHDKSVDYWSLGALLYEMLAGAPPFYSRDKNQMFKNVLEKPLDLKPFFSPEACSVLSALLVVDPKRRLSNPVELKRHEYFKGLNWDKLARREIKAPFQPALNNNRDLKYFDKMFTGESLSETPINRAAGTMGNTYKGFTYDEE